MHWVARTSFCDEKFANSELAVNMITHSFKYAYPLACNVLNFDRQCIPAV